MTTATTQTCWADLLGRKERAGLTLRKAASRAKREQPGSETTAPMTGGE